MLALFFEVCPRPGQMQRYLEIAAAMRPLLDAAGGCLFIDRFRSLDRDGWLLSYQIWRDEAAMTAWRVHAGHHKAQCQGREEVFSDYRLRVAQVIHEDKPERAPWQPPRLSAYNDAAARPPRHMLVIDAGGPVELPGGITAERYESLYRPGKFAQVAPLESLDQGLGMRDFCRTGAALDSLRLCEIERDYGMFERAEAPQFYPPVARPVA